MTRLVSSKEELEKSQKQEATLTLPAGRFCFLWAHRPLQFFVCCSGNFFIWFKKTKRCQSGFISTGCLQNTKRILETRRSGASRAADPENTQT